MASFLKPVAEGGVQARFPDGGIAFEEYPYKQPNIVLNGLITSIVGLYDLSILGVEQAAEIFAESIESLEGNLWRYDSGFWTRHDLTGYVASTNYHQYHIQQLWGLHEMTGRAVFKDFSEKWEKYPGSVRVRFARGLTIAKKLVKRPEMIAPAIKKLFHRSV